MMILGFESVMLRGFQILEMLFIFTHPMPVAKFYLLYSP